MGAFCRHEIGRGLGHGFLQQNELKLGREQVRPAFSSKSAPPTKTVRKILSNQWECRLMRAFKPFHHTGFWSKDTSRAKIALLAQGTRGCAPFFYADIPAGLPACET
jgi:hypothetical protein